MDEDIRWGYSMRTFDEDIRWGHLTRTFDDIRNCGPKRQCIENAQEIHGGLVHVQGMHPLPEDRYKGVLRHIACQHPCSCGWSSKLRAAIKAAQRKVTPKQFLKSSKNQTQSCRHKVSEIIKVADTNIQTQNSKRDPTHPVVAGGIIMGLGTHLQSNVPQHKMVVWKMSQSNEPFWGVQK